MRLKAFLGTHRKGNMLTLFLSHAKELVQKYIWNHALVYGSVGFGQSQKSIT